MNRVSRVMLQAGSRRGLSTTCVRWNSAKFFVPGNEEPRRHGMFSEDPEITTPKDIFPLGPPTKEANMVDEPELPMFGEGLTMDEVLALPHPEGREREPAEVKRKRLLWESRKRGILEMELLLGTFAADNLSTMSERQLNEYDRFLSLPDWPMYYFATEKRTAPEPWASSWILKSLVHYTRNSEKESRRMPELK